MAGRSASGQVVRDGSCFALYPDRLEAAPFLAWSYWSKWSNHFEESVKNKYQSPTTTRACTAVAELAKKG